MRKIFLMLIIGLFLITTINSCGILNSEDKIYATSIDSVKVSSVNSNSVSFLTYITTSSSCWSFSNITIDKIPVVNFPVDTPYDLYQIKVFVKRNDNELCMDIVEVIEIPVVVDIGNSQLVRFNFWQNNSTYLDTMIDIRGYLPD